MNTAVIKINNLDQALMLSRAYKEGEIKLNVSKLARELNCSRKTLSRRLNGIAPKKTRNRKRYLDDYKDLIYKYLCDEQRNFDYINHIYYFMKREHGITCTRSTFFRYIRITKSSIVNLKITEPILLSNVLKPILVNRLSSI